MNRIKKHKKTSALQSIPHGWILHESTFSLLPTSRVAEDTFRNTFAAGPFWVENFNPRQYPGSLFLFI